MAEQMGVYAGDRLVARVSFGRANAPPPTSLPEPSAPVSTLPRIRVEDLQAALDDSTHFCLRRCCWSLHGLRDLVLDLDVRDRPVYFVGVEHILATLRGLAHARKVGLAGPVTVVGPVGATEADIAVHPDAQPVLDALTAVHKLSICDTMGVLCIPSTVRRLTVYGRASARLQAPADSVTLRDVVGDIDLAGHAVGLLDYKRETESTSTVRGVVGVRELRVQDCNEVCLVAADAPRPDSDVDSEGEGDGGLYFTEPLLRVERVSVSSVFAFSLAVLAGAHVQCMTVKYVALLAGTLSGKVDRLEALAEYPEEAAKWAAQLGATLVLLDEIE